MDFAEQMLSRNRVWAHEMARRDPALFGRMRQGQRPAILWIGCSDSRVPAEIVTGAAPGDLFVHRNVANLFLPHDDNSMSVLEYAVRVLEVGDIVVCGHYGCGGVRAALEGTTGGMPHVERRIGALRELVRREREVLTAIPGIEERANWLAELNAVEQARMLNEIPLVRDAVSRPRVHAWIFDIRSGLIRRLASSGDSSLGINAQRPAANDHRETTSVWTI
jgi:carbonic anhydrase